MRNSQLYTIGFINKKIYQVVTSDIRATEVIITDKQIQHIKSRHPLDFEQYAAYFKDILADPDYILADTRPNTAIILKEITIQQVKLKLILRIQTTSDPENFKNSIITFQKIENKRYLRYIRNGKILYKKGDIEL